jgi:ATP-dependent DNA ligase
MLAALADDLPRGDYLYEPKWDGFRCLAFREGDDIDLRSRHGRALARYFPELVEALRGLPAHRFALDGEIVVPSGEGFDFAALLQRIHPAASRVERLRHETPARLVAFDLVSLAGDDLSERPFGERRELLARLLDGAGGSLVLTPATRDYNVAAGWIDRYEGVVAKHELLPYRPGKRDMIKVKRERTADCVVAGFRWLPDRPLPSSLLLGLYDEAGALQHVGVVTSFSEGRRRELLEEIAPLAAPLRGHPWEHGFLLGGGSAGRLPGSAGRWTPAMEMDWVPLAPERVVEVAYDRTDDDRFRHPARFRRWRPDREARSCLLDQLRAA